MRLFETTGRRGCSTRAVSSSRSHALALKANLDALVVHYERPSFIDQDPISIPHGFDDPRDQEVIGLYAALLAWGQRKTVLAKMNSLCERMRFRPYEFVLNFKQVRDAGRLEGFKHRTFQPVDALWLTSGLSHVLRTHGSIDALFAETVSATASTAEEGLNYFGHTLIATTRDSSRRSWKHVARPSSGSACKRLNMYLRWMVRPGPVDLGLWKSIRPDQLVLPLDVHSGRTARSLGLLTRPSNDWKAAIELTDRCRLLSPEDPCRYDFVFFGEGAIRGRGKDEG